MDSENWYVQFPMVAFNQLPELSGAEIKLLIYIQRHTKNYNVTSRILSIDEIANGRLRKDGSRHDSGTGLSERAIRNAIKSLEEKGLLMVTEDRGGYRAFSLLPAEPQPQGRQKVSMADSLDRQKVSLPASDDRQKVPDLPAQKDRGERQKVPVRAAENAAGSLDEAASGEASPAPIDTLLDTLQDTLIDTRRLSMQELEAEIAGISRVLNPLLAQAKQLQQEASSGGESTARKARVQLREIGSDIERLQNELAEKQLLCDDLYAILEAEEPAGETLEELAPEAGIPQASEQQEADRQRLRAIKDELIYWREGLRMCLGANTFGKWRGHTRDEIEQKIRGLTTQKNALLARVKES